MPDSGRAAVAVDFGRSRYEYLRKPGEVATITVDTNLVTPIGTHRPGTKPSDPVYRHTTALVTVEGERLYRTETSPIDKHRVTFKVPVTQSMFPSVGEINVAAVQDRQIYAQSLTIEVPHGQTGISLSK